MPVSRPKVPETHRIQKKQRRRAVILENAIALFRKSGIRSTKSVEIAAASDISPATLFNYFPTKDDLAEAWVRGEIALCLDEMVSESETRGLRSNLRSRCQTLAEASCHERDLRLEAWSCAGRAATSSLSSLAALESLIEREQGRDRIRGDLTARALSELLNEAIEGGLIAGLRESNDALQIAASIRSRIDVILDGIRKRNERVQPPSTKHG